MDREKRKQRQTIRLIVTEIVMVVAVVLTVILLTFIAMGYNVNKDGEVGQSGLVQLRSHPAGATVIVDGDTLLPKTNTSRMLTAGAHAITLTKDGYDSWEKEVVSESGRLIKLAYPRLFLQNRTAKKVKEYGAELAFFEPATNRDALIYAKNGSSKWTFLDIRGDGAEETELDFSEVVEGQKVLNVKWNGNSDRILAELEKDGTKSFMIANIKSKKVMNLTKEFDKKFSKVEFAGDTGEKLYALEKGNLYTIVASESSISQSHAAKVVDFFTYDDKVIYLTEDNTVKMYQEGADDVEVTKFSKDKQVKIALTEYLNYEYIYLVVDNRVYIYMGEYPTSDKKLADMKLVIESDIEFVPKSIIVQGEGELILATNGKQMAVFDAELGKLSEFKTENSNTFMIDEYLVGEIAAGKLIVRDFDGTNRRELTNATGRAVITKNNKWLYYLRSEGKKTIIYREQILN